MSLFYCRANSINCHNNMEHCLQDKQTQPEAEISIHLQDIFSYFTELSQMFSLLQSNHQDSIEMSRVDQKIKQHMNDFNSIYQMMLQKLNLERINFPLHLNQSQPIEQILNHPGTCPHGQIKQPTQNSDRKCYRKYSREQKNQVIQLHNNGMSFYAIGKRLGIPYKNVKRWCTQQEDDKNKKWVNFTMQKKMWLWLQSHPKKEQLRQCDIQRQSLKLSQNPHFKASRGWVRNFLRRCQCANEEVLRIGLSKFKDTNE